VEIEFARYRLFERGFLASASISGAVRAVTGDRLRPALALLLLARPGAASAPSIRTPADLLGRPFIAGSMLKSPARWEFGSEDGIRAAQIFDVTMFANTNVAVRAAVESGGGFTILPDFAVRSRLESGSLIRLLDKWSLPSGDV
jgi:DNA-binding transcriptional LysR family regulator